MIGSKVPVPNILYHTIPVLLASCNFQQHREQKQKTSKPFFIETMPISKWVIM